MEIGCQGQQQVLSANMYVIVYPVFYFRLVIQLITLFFFYQIFYIVIAKDLLRHVEHFHRTALPDRTVIPPQCT